MRTLTLLEKQTQPRKPQLKKHLFLGGFIYNRGGGAYLLIGGRDYEVVTPPSHLKHQAPSTTRAFNKLPSSAAGSTLAPRRGLQRKAAAQAKAHQPSRRRQHHLLPRTNRGTFVEHSGNSSNPNCKKWAPCDAKVEFIETLSRFLPYHKRASPPPPRGPHALVFGSIYQGSIFGIYF